MCLICVSLTLGFADNKFYPGEKCGVVPNFQTAAGEISTRKAHNYGPSHPPPVNDTALYGSISSRFKAGVGPGVITSFFLMMDQGPENTYRVSDSIALDIIGTNATFAHFRSFVGNAPGPHGSVRALVLLSLVTHLLVLLLNCNAFADGAWLQCHFGLPHLHLRVERNGSHAFHRRGVQVCFVNSSEEAAAHFHVYLAV
jgi:hypothetical protein